MTITFFTGSGVSAESGIATFRTEGGLWKQYDLNVVCNIDTWRDNYDTVHTFYNTLRRQMSSAQPNAFHYAVAKWSNEHDVINITQNADDLFERAGCKNVIHVHGYYKDLKCIACGHEFQTSGDWNIADPCPQCLVNDRNMKPNVVFFGETAPRYDDMYQAIRNVFENDLLIVAGTSEQVIPISSYMQSLGTNIKVDPAPKNSTMINDQYHEYLEMSAVESVPFLEKMINSSCETGSH